MGTPPFSIPATHCGADDCNLFDFIPFNCDRCDQVFCLQHKSYTKHQCPVVSQIDVTVLICPLCSQAVRLLPNEDPNITWDVHVNCECDPSNYRSTSKKCCPVPECKEALLFSNTIRCKDCAQEHCLRHRFALDHNCAGPEKSRSGFPYISVLRRSLKREFTPIRSSNDSVNWGLNLRNSARSIRASAEAGMQKLSVVTNQALQKARDGMMMCHGALGGELMELCLQCGARFSNVNALIDHAEKIHVHTALSACSFVAVDVCPLCSKTFRDPVLLVEHVENHVNALLIRLSFVTSALTFKIFTN